MLELKDKLGRFKKGNKGYWLNKKRSIETKLKISQASKNRIRTHIGKKRTVAGYIKIYLPEHHRAQKDGYVLEHIVIMEQKIGKRIDRDECVHHINGIKDDNRIENLVVIGACQENLVGLPRG